MESSRLYSSLPLCDPKKNRALIDTGALVRNYQKLLAAARRDSPSAAGICVVKADAYGHSNEICAPALAEAGCRHFAVSCVGEAVALRRILSETVGSGAEILILGYTPPEDAALLLRYDITQCLFSPEYAGKLDDAARELDGSVKVHIKLDTGMNRLGFRAQSPDDAASVAREIAAAVATDRISVTGMFTHFARADEMSAEGDAATVAQLRAYEAVDADLLRLGIDAGFRHVCNSAGAVRFPQFAKDGVRLGILLYGCGDKALTGFETEPVMRLETVISHIHELRRGESVGYGGEFTAPRDMKIATLPIGYADGFIRAYAGASVKTGGYTVPLVGRICMDQCMADVSGTDAKVGDRVALFGERRGVLDELARRAGTIDYECLCLISARVPRIG